MKDIIIKADDLYFSYDDEKSYSLNGMSLEIERGKKVAFMVANGAGKSTFFSLSQWDSQTDSRHFVR